MFRCCVLLGISWLAAFPNVAAAQSADASLTTTPLDQYVQEQDPRFDWVIERTVVRPTHTELSVRLTSQVWRSETEVSHPVWRHWLQVVVPHDAKAETALLFITGGSRSNEPPQQTDPRLVQIALSTASVVAELRDVPNQPIEFRGDGQQRYEDNLLAASWVECMSDGDPTWIAQLAMTKSAVAAMTAVEQVMAQQKEAPRVDRFVVAGGSKRGWTTWLTAAVDSRVVAIAPIVIDVLNIRPSMQHHYASYGFWSEALGDYERQGLADRLDDEESSAIRQIVDPFVYRDRLTLPKCLINASGDEFFLPDSSRYYFGELAGEKHLSYTPNVGHSLRGSDALDTLVAFHASVVHRLERPVVTWTGDHSTLRHTIRCSAAPTEALLWRAVNPSARDFRFPQVGPAYEATPIEPDSTGVFEVTLDPPPEGWSATFVRFSFDIGAPRPWRVTTPVWVVPDAEPFASQETGSND